MEVSNKFLLNFWHICILTINIMCTFSLSNSVNNYRGRTSYSWQLFPVCNEKKENLEGAYLKIISLTIWNGSFYPRLFDPLQEGAVWIPSNYSPPHMRKGYYPRQSESLFQWIASFYLRFFGSLLASILTVVKWGKIIQGNEIIQWSSYTHMVMQVGNNSMIHGCVL